MNKIRTACALLLILALSACSSGGGGGGGGFVVPEVLSEAPGASFDDDGIPINGNSIQASTLAKVAVAFNELQTAIDDGSLAAATIPTAGSATLNGYVGIRRIGTAVIALGHLTIVATFGAGMSGTVKTTATDFRDFDFSAENPVVAMSGVSGGILSGTGPITGKFFASSLGGKFNTDDGEGNIDIINIEANLEGEFYDAGRLVVHGGISGTATGSSLSDDYAVDGRFAASEVRE